MRPVSSFVTVTVTPGSTAFWESRTVPLISARPPCASTGAAAPRMEQVSSQTESRHRVRIEASLETCKRVGELRGYWSGAPVVSTTNRAALQENLRNATRVGDGVEGVTGQYAEGCSFS